ncbi:MAG: TonB-dependent receptor plug domain-containing protein [Paramuribaculum sp.]|nr:TonB-dependent receptor plug domain-containing protein [Paramuribaculum sp.]
MKEDKDNQLFRHRLSCINYCALCIVHCALIALSINASAQSRVNRLGEVVAWGKRPMKEIGVQKTSFDSLALKENIALSMADILTFNSSVFVKSYGRATLSTVAFRGTSPSHTQVTWNGMRINSPMLGMTDFSTIPSYFIDQATLLHGTSSVNETGGGLGGAVKLGTLPSVAPGFNLQYVQGIGSFRTFDEFARFTYGNDHWDVSTRVVYSSSPNDYTYINHDKRENIYDDNHQIIGWYHPKERNRSGSYKDFHALQEVYYNTGRGDRFGLNAWYIRSNRELPMLTTDYGYESDFDNRQKENTLRAVASWDHRRSSWRTGLRAGYIHTRMGYDYSREVAPGIWADMTRSRSRVNTVYGQAEGEYSPSRRLYLTASLSAHQHFVKSADKNVILQDGDRAIVGYNKARVELSGSASAKWQPIDRLGLSAVVRQEMAGTTWAPVIPALFVDGILSSAGNVMVKASVSRNHKFPTLNDLYFLPGGNPNLLSESGWTYDAGVSFDIGGKKPFPFSMGGSITWFDSRIDNWIIWLPTTKGFFSPRNVKKVHAYGIEGKLNVAFEPAKGWVFDLSGSYSWTPSINEGEKLSPADRSVGKQLPYVPRHSASLTGRLTWRSWSFLYKWAYYSERYTMSSNDITLTGALPPYFMSNISLEKNLKFRPVDLQLKLAVNNLFNEDYLSVLSRPMPGINFEFFIGITPKFGKK